MRLLSHDDSGRGVDWGVDRRRGKRKERLASRLGLAPVCNFSHVYGYHPIPPNHIIIVRGTLPPHRFEQEIFAKKRLHREGCSREIKTS